MSQRRTIADQSFAWIFGGLTLLGLLILVGPVLIVLITSFTTSASLKFPPPELSLRWYQALFDGTRSAHIHRAAGNSLWVACLWVGDTDVLLIAWAAPVAHAFDRRAFGGDCALCLPDHLGNRHPIGTGVA